MRYLLAFLSAAMAVVAFIGCVAIVFPGINAYMVASGRAAPGEPIFLDELALPLTESFHDVGIGIALVAAALLVRRLIRHKTQRDNSSPDQASA